MVRFFSLDNTALDALEPKRIAVVVGESSGDILGAGLIASLKKRYPDCHFEGIGGPLMIAQGFDSLFPMDRLSVMGLVDPLLRLPELLSILKQLKRRFIETKPDIFIGIDAPDFNLRLERSLKDNHIFTVHYVSPSVWAWRQGRIKTIEKSVDLMLTLFPFEAEFYRGHKVDVAFVGHTLADDIPLLPDQNQAKKRLSLDLKKRYVALLPGSRQSEVARLIHVFLDAGSVINESFVDVEFLVPAANAQRKKQIIDCLSQSSLNKVHVFDGMSHDAMLSSDVVVMASGTTTLEAMLLKRPMVIAYRMGFLSFAIISRLVKVTFIGLPNLLAGKLLVPEFIQSEARCDTIADAVVSFLNDAKKCDDLKDEYYQIHNTLRKNASECACEAILLKWREH